MSAATLLVSACGSGGEGKQAQTFGSLVLFDPTAASAIIPFPFDGLFNGFTAPTLNVPGTPAPLSDINQLDGFSTTASIFADVAGTLDYSTLPGHVIIINTSTGAVLVPGTDFTVDNENATATDPVSQLQTPISSQRSRLLISPLKPLAPSTRYIVALTKGIKTTGGNDVIASDSFRITSSATKVSQQNDPALANFSATQQAELEALRSQLIYPVVQALSATIPADQLVLAWSFTTQSIDKTLNLVAQNATAGAIAVANTGLSTGQSGIPGLGLASVYAGITTVPYYLNVAASNHDPSPLAGFWQADPTKPDTTVQFLGQVPCGAFAQGATVNGVTLKPSASTTACFPYLKASTAQVQKLPILVTVPNANSGKSKPASGWPVVIFQHGITQNRENIFAVADGLAAAGFIVVAMDLPLHGITNTADPFYHNQVFAAAAPSLVTGERTFDLDLENNSTGAAGPDGKIDGSGTYFINLQSLITSRDNLREAVADLITLGKTVKTLSLSNGATPDVDPNRIYYFGHSLGGIVGGTLLGVDSDIRAAVLANPGGGVAKLLDASKSFGPVISAGLGAAGVAEGSDTYETFLRFAQTLVDSGDPVNYGAKASAGHAIHLIEVANDLVVPNSAPTTCPSPLPSGILSTAALVAACPATSTEDVEIETGYLSGTDPLIAAQGLTIAGPVTVPVASPNVIKSASNLEYAVKFAAGSHSTVLDPTANPAETQEMQNEAAQFLASDGHCLPIGGTCQ
jgi:dienelactone hydrolase